MSEASEAYYARDAIKHIRPKTSKGHELAIDHLIYQYRTIDSFWKIIKSDTFWATESRFSNDSEERVLGIKTGELFNYKNNFIPNSFIVCFCEDKDRLSQWRGYSPHGGVSIGFDFSATTVTPQQFTFFRHAKDAQSLLCGCEVDSNDVASKWLAPSKTFYVPRPACKSDKRKYAIISAFSVDSSRLTEDEVESYFPDCIPFIKHKGFKEEGEMRFVANGNDDCFTPDKKRVKVDDYINYKPEGNKEVPYVIIRPGNAAYMKKNCVVRVRIIEGMNGIINNLRKNVKNAEIICCKDSSRGFDDEQCFGCIQRTKITRTVTDDERCSYRGACNDEFIMSPYMKDCIVISQGCNQREVFETVYDIVQKYNDAIKVWCEGHLPIRSITVGPSANMNEIKESIKHYCEYSTNYWLRDVKIKKSKIPYRIPAE